MKYSKKRKKASPIKKTGMAPGMYLFTGEQKMDIPNIELLAYDKDEINEFKFNTIEEALLKMEGLPQMLWLNIEGLHEVEIVKKIVEQYDLHKLTGEDILSIGQRPKIDDYEHYIHAVTKMFQIKDEHIIDEQITIVFGERLLITFQEKEGDVFDHVRNRLFENKGTIRSRESDYLAYALLDSIVDHYFIAIEHFANIIEEFEIEVLSHPSEQLLPKLNELRQEAAYIRRSIFPLREAVSQFEKLESPFMHKETRFFIRDLYDHTIQVIDSVSVLKESVSGLLDLYMSSVSNRMNNVMKVLTIVSTIFIPLTFIAGIYGMNFTNMPELEYKYGYLITMIGMAVLTLLMIFYFKRKKWL
ncbi:MAG TPA: magnesium/cobalt transporter CorA [Brumimicrobium sp.]|nr:magnesium/cobalt transporter CorA [Brumimicrobium sp.]